MRQIITLVGTSVLTNGRRELKLKDPTAGQLVDYLRNTDETRGSAETNSLQHLLQEDDGVIFVHSDTPEGRLCAYESFGEIIEFPRFPISFDLGVIERHYGFFSWIDQEPRDSRQVRDRLHQVEPVAQMLLEELEESGGQRYTFLSPLGEALLQAYRADRGITEEIELSPLSGYQPAEKLRFVEDEVNQPRGTLEFARRLARIGFVAEVREGELLDTTRSRVQREFKDGDQYKIRVIYSDGDKGVYITLTTTARTSEQNNLVRRQVEEVIGG